MAVTPTSVLAAALVACPGDSSTEVKPEADIWTVSPDPIMEIGAGSDAAYQFHQIVGVASGGDGRLVVVDRRRHTLRIFSQEGELIHEFGGEGDGPGEFRHPIGVAVRDDSVVVIEGMFGPGRVQLFHPLVGFRWGSPLNRDDTSPAVTPLDIISRRTLLVVRGAGPRETTPPPDREVIRDSVTLGVLRIAERQTISWIGNFANQSWFSYPMPPGFAVDRGVGRYRLGASLVIGASDDTVWIGDSGTGLIKVFDTSGVLVREFAAPIKQRAFDEAAIQTAKAAELAGVADPDRFGRRASIEIHYSRNIRPPTVPRFTRLVGGPDGEMWVELFSEVPDAKHAAVVLDRNGRQLGRVRIPPGLILHAVTNDRVIGVRRDSLELERIVVHQLGRR